MIVVRVENPDDSGSIHLANSYLAYDRRGGSGVLVDSNGLVPELLEEAAAAEVEIAAFLVTHHHSDHVVGLERMRAEAGGPPLVMHELTAELIGVEADRTVTDGDDFEAGGIRVRALDTPGHCVGHIAFLVGDEDVFTADALFAGSLGVTLSYGPDGLKTLRASIMDKLMTLPPETRVHAGHARGSTVGEEWENNVFIRTWRGLDPELNEPCRARNLNEQWEDATLVVWGPNYDGGNKAWIRFNDGAEAILSASRVTRL